LKYGIEECGPALSSEWSASIVCQPATNAENKVSRPFMLEAVEPIDALRVGR
jgi:hypothetical protein